MSETRREVDVAIIGAGSAGLSAARVVRAERMTPLLIDGGPHGTTCARVGCMPSKLLIAAADAAHQVKQAGLFGVRVGESHVDGREVMARVQRERDRFVGFVLKTTDEAQERGELLQGRATIAAPDRLVVRDEEGVEHEVSFKSLIIATGSEPIVPKPFRELRAPVMITNQEIFDLEDLPESLLVIGLGVIGLELGQAMHRLGVRVTLLGTEGKIGPITDPEVLEAAHQILCAELDMHSRYELQHITPLEGEQGVEIAFIDSSGAARTERFQKVLMAAGRRPSLDGLGLDAVGLGPDAKGNYPINHGTLQLGDLPFFVAGDANALHPLLHEAADDGRIAGKNAVVYPEVLSPRRRTPLAIMFCDPQIALIGHRFADLDEDQVAVGEVSYADQGRARVMAQHRGVFKVYGNPETGCLLGGEFIGPGAEHMAHLLSWAVQRGMTVDDALAMPFYHPVLEEGLRTALRSLSTAMKHKAALVCRVAELGVGS